MFRGVVLSSYSNRSTVIQVPAFTKMEIYQTQMLLNFSDSNDYDLLTVNAGHLTKSGLHLAVGLGSGKTTGHFVRKIENKCFCKRLGEFGKQP